MDKGFFLWRDKHLRRRQPCAQHAGPAVAPTGTKPGNGTSLWTTRRLCQRFPQSYAQGAAYVGRSCRHRPHFSTGVGTLGACSEAFAALAAAPRPLPLTSAIETASAGRPGRCSLSLNLGGRQGSRRLAQATGGFPPALRDARGTATRHRAAFQEHCGVPCPALALLVIL